MTLVRRRISIACAAVLAAAACTPENPAGLEDADMLMPPEAPTDTTGFVPPSNRF